MNSKLTSLTKWPISLKLRAIFVMFIALWVLFFTYLKIVPSGHISYSLKWPAGFRTGHGFIYDFKPGERLENAKSGLKVFGDPAYFSLFTPRGFNQAIVTVKYIDRLSSSTPEFSVGVLMDRLSGAYETQPLENQTIDGLTSWTFLTENGLTLGQGGNEYSSVSEFLADLKAGRVKDCPGGPLDCVAAYNYDLPLTAPTSLGQDLKPLIITQPLRGAHQFYVYLNKGAVRFSFDLVDLNLDQAADPVTISLRHDGEAIASKTLTDENRTAPGKSENKSLSLEAQIPESGPYKVEVRASDDIVIARISSPSDKLSFINHLWPVSGKGNLELFTDSAYLRAETLNPASLSPIEYAGNRHQVNKTDKPFIFKGNQGVNAVTIAKDDLVLENNGVFSFSRSNLFDPAYRTIDPYQMSDTRFKYLIAAYQKPSEKNGVKTATAALGLTGADRQDGKYSLMFSIPGLNGTKEAENYLEIKEIKINLSGRSLSDKIKSLLGL